MHDISQQLIEQVKTAINSKTPLNIQGNNTKTGLGRQGLAASEVLSISEHSGIVNYEPGELVLTARAGTSLAEIDTALAEHGQFLACDPRRYEGRATLGGSLAANQSGSGRPWFGSLRDHVLGTRVINGRGEHLRFGGQVMKNVAGYDVSRLQAGAMGTLGVITEVSLKVLPQPDFKLTLKTEINANDALEQMNKLAGSTKPVTALCWVSGSLYVRLQGAGQSVNATAKLWQDNLNMQLLDDTTADLFWEQLREQQLAFHTETTHQALWQFSVNPAAAHFLEGQTWLFDWSGAQRWLIGEFDLELLTNHAKRAGGEVRLYQGGKDTQEINLVQNPALRRIQQNLKTSLDPQHIFNPGRLFSWL